MEADRNEPAEHSLRRALAGRKISAGVLRSITQVVQATPEIASTPLEKITAISESVFETVRHVEIVPQKDGSEFQWEMCQPSLLLARTLQDSETLAIKSLCGHPGGEAMFQRASLASHLVFRRIHAWEPQPSTNVEENYGCRFQFSGAQGRGA